MGCDIHSYAEIFWGKTDPSWMCVGKFWPYEYHNEDNFPRRYVEWEANETLTLHPWGGRNYNLFALLADVRNGYGFAGVDTGDAVEPLSIPRGLPDNLSEYVAKENKEWNGDGHSHSYFTLKELLEFSGERIKTERGWVRSEQYILFKKDGKPKSYCGGVDGQHVEHIDAKEMDRRIDQNKLTEHEYTQVEWQTDLAPLLSKLTARMEMLSKFEEDTDKIRLIFWFDN